MEQHTSDIGTRWGALFGARARVWADTWEGSQGWGTHAYKYVLDRADVRSGTAVLDCGCGAGRFVRLAADRGAKVAGIDAASELVKIAAGRTPKADLRVGDFQALPWPDGSFEIVTGFSTFQFADDHRRALTEARRVSRGQVWVVVPTRLADSGLPRVFAPLIELIPPDALPNLKLSGMFALSAPGMLERALTRARMSPRSDATIDAAVVFPDVAAAVDAFLSAGATALAIQHAGQPAVEALHAALEPFSRDLGRVTLPGWLRVVEAG